MILFFQILSYLLMTLELCWLLIAILTFLAYRRTKRLSHLLMSLGTALYFLSYVTIIVLSHGPISQQTFFAYIPLIGHLLSIGLTLLLALGFILEMLHLLRSSPKLSAFPVTLPR